MTHVVFIHLDLGIGGAESLVINLAKATLPSNNKGTNNDNSSTISIYTTHCSPSHCYDEVKPPSGSLSPHVYIRGSWIPRSISSHFTALCSSIRMLYLTIRAYTEHPNADVFVMDVLPTGIPYLILWKNVMGGVLFYCHFPDKLLTRDTVNGEECCITTTDSVNCVNEREKIGGIKSVLTRMKTWYRWCLDAVEECTMNYSDLIVVNSKFTMGEVEKVFPSLFVNSIEEDEDESGTDDNDEKRLATSRVQVLYPAIESSLSCKTNNNNNETHHDNLHSHKMNSAEEHSQINSNVKRTCRSSSTPKPYCLDTSGIVNSRLNSHHRSLPGDTIPSMSKMSSIWPSCDCWRIRYWHSLIYRLQWLFLPPKGIVMILLHQMIIK